MFLSTLENFQLLWKDFGQSGKFLNNQRKFPAILKTFWTPWKVFTYYRMFPDPLESFLTQKNFWTPNSFMKIWKELGHSRKFPKTLRVFGKSRKFLGTLKSFGQSEKFLDTLANFKMFWKVSGLSQLVVRKVFAHQSMLSGTYSHSLSVWEGTIEENIGLCL